MPDLAFRSIEPMTQAEFERWLETVPASDLHHYELLDGFVVMEPPAGWPHGEIEAEIVGRLREHVRRRKLGRLFGSSQGFALPSGDTVEPDVAFVSKKRWVAPPGAGFLRVVPDLVVEILSPGTSRIDRREKRAIYFRNGVREYWLVDPTARSVLRLWDAADEGRIFTSQETLVSRVLPGLRIPVAGMFPDE